MKVGSRVVCINIEGLVGKEIHVSKLPVMGGIYTIRSIAPQLKRTHERPGILLEEISGNMEYIKCCDGIRRIVEYHFFQYRFVEILTDEEQKAEEKKKQYAKLKICY
jgi:hypothetical protein